MLPNLNSQSQLDQLEASILSQREEAKINQMKQAQRMIQRSKIVLSNAEIGDNVAIPIPHVDRGKGDPKNILGVVIDRDERLMYTVATKSGVLKGKYSRNQFNVWPVRLLTTETWNLTQTVSLRSAVVQTSLCNGQGFVKCNCSGPKRCQTKKCSCFKARLQCNSRCHHTLSCKNKTT